MTTALQPLSDTTEFDDVLASLQSLTRDFLLGFRLQVGKLLLDRFYAGDIFAYRSKDPTKAASFSRFAETRSAELTDLGLSVAGLRQCINARAAWDQLPAEVRDKLQFSHIVELSRVSDSTQRARLAMDTTLQNWRVDQLRTAIGKSSSGRYYDTDPTTPGTQPPADTAQQAAKPRTSGRMLAQFERTLDDLDSLRADWVAADTAKMSAAHKERAFAVVAGLKLVASQIEASLAGSAQS